MNADLLAKAKAAMAAKAAQKLAQPATPAEGGYKTIASSGLISSSQPASPASTSQQAIASPASSPSLDPVAKAKALLLAKLASKQVQASQPAQPAQPASGIHILDRYGNQIQLNAKQAEFATLASQRQSAVLIGAAGTGKTTSMKAAIKLLIDSGIGLLESNGHKKLVTSGTPAIVGCAYTRIAVANLRANMPDDMKPNCLTIHALLEYQPVFEDYVDEHGNFRTKKYFAPNRNATNPLDTSIRCIIIDEASMLDLELFKLLLDAIQHPVQFIFLGDINQLPPVFGSAVLGFAMNALPTVELTEVYRNAGPIVSFAHRILSGKPVTANQLDSVAIPDTVKVQPWKKKLYAEDAVIYAAKLLINAFDHKLLDPELDMILCPFNKAFGTDYLNRAIAHHLSVAKGEPTYEIVAGWKKVYLAVGDRVLYEKEPAKVINISSNMSYRGVQPQPADIYLDREGLLTKQSDTLLGTTATSLDQDIDDFLDSVVSATGEDTQAEGAARAASHVVTLQLADGSEVSLDTAGQLNALLLGYVLTVHKAQGSEWRKVILVTHHSHNSMLARELLYTAVTRAKESIHIIGEPDVLERGITNQKIVGNNLQAKAEYFKGKASNMDISWLRWS